MSHHDDYEQCFYFSPSALSLIHLTVMSPCRNGSSGAQRVQPCAAIDQLHMGPIQPSLHRLPPPPSGKTHKTIATVASTVCQTSNRIDSRPDCKVPSSTEARNSIGHSGARAIQMRKLANAAYAIGDGPRPSKELRRRTRTLLALAVEASTCALERVNLCAVL